MRFLVDTQLLIWYLGDDPKLPPKGRHIILAQDSVLFFSLVTIWEVAIKSALKKPGFSVQPQKLLQGLRVTGWNEIRIEPGHIFRVLELPQLHRDPFDRMLVAQAQAENLTLLTTDKSLTLYDVASLYV